MATVTRQQLKPRPLGKGSLAALLRLGDLQKQEPGRAVPVAELIDIQSRLEWGYIQAMATRHLIETVTHSSVRLTRAGWSTYGRHRS